MTFQSLGLSPELVRAVRERGYERPTPIQSAAIPAILRGQDVLGQAQTGSGKTAAFVLPLLQQLGQARRETPRRTHTLIVVPTRELAAQVAEVVRQFAQHLAVPVKTAVVFGGVSINPQMMGLRGGADLVVATPGRLLDLAAHNAVRLDAVSALVLDEADRLLDLGFEDELRRVLALLPARRQTLLFSATLPAAVQALAGPLLHQPLHVEAPALADTQPKVVQRAIEVDTGRRTQLLRHLVQQSGSDRVLVFVASKYAADLVAHKLGRAGIHAAPFHGDLSQGARRDTLLAFKANELQVLVATDVAARGIDIVLLPMVVNYDLPRAAVDYVHRIGRTGRAGHGGTAISFIGAEAEAHFRLIEKRQGMRVPRERVAGFEPEDVAAVTSDAAGGVKGLRKSKKDKLREAAADGG
jgi:superfamily II DNA/RNA helicase